MTGAALWFGRALCWVVILGIALVVTVAVLVPRIGDATPYAVLTGSMRPDYPPGTLVVVRPVAPEEVGVGDVVTYQLASGEQVVVTHRVVAVSANLAGERMFITQGDANEVPDEEPVRPVQLRGRLWYSVPYVGHLTRLLTARERQLATYGAAGALGCYAIVMFAGALRHRGHRQSVVT